jgi:hypothetical protein
MTEVEITCTCPFCGKKTTIKVEACRYEKWLNHDGNVQDIFPDYSAEKREMLITGMCQKCQEETFGK